MIHDTLVVGGQYRALRPFLYKQTGKLDQHSKPIEEQSTFWIASWLAKEDGYVDIVFSDSQFGHWCPSTTTFQTTIKTSWIEYVYSDIERDAIKSMSREIFIRACVQYDPTTDAAYETMASNAIRCSELYLMAEKKARL